MLRPSATAAFVFAAALAAQSPSLQTALRPLDAAALDLAQKGRSDAARELAKVLESLGYEAKALAKLRAAIDQQKAAKGREANDKLAAAVRKALQPLVAELAKAQGDAQQKLAAAIVRIDGDCEAAQTALGRRRVGAQWLDEAQQQCKARVPVIEQAILDARRLPFAVEQKQGHHPLYAAIGVDPVTELHLGELTVYTDWPAPKAARALRTAAQGSALSHWLAHEPLAYTPGHRVYFHFGQQVLYRKAIDWLLAQKTIDEGEATAVRALLAFDLPTRERLLQDLTEGAFAVSLVHDEAYARIPQRWLLAGHVDWIGRMAIGAALGRFTFVDAHKTASQSAADAEREAMERLGQAGILGARSYLVWLVQHDQDPRWDTTFVDQIGKLAPDAVAKNTFVHDWLVQRDVLATLIKAPAAPRDFVTAAEQALGLQWAQLEPRWRSWLTGGTFFGIADKLAGKGMPQPLSADEQKGLAHLNDVRRMALAKQLYREPEPPAVTFERELADGARAHANYLQQNPDQAAKWPDVHEEWPERPGFTPAGSFAAGNSVIAGAGDTPSAIDQWMSTFYHRLPLTAPGLLRTGFAIEQGTAVLDAQSMAMPSNATHLLSLWPSPGMTEVPLHFAPEAPNPVPGADQSVWGYPVTFQHHLADPYDPAKVTMTLHLGGRSGPVVDCWYSSPVVPTNPEMAPADCYGLIPKQALAAKSDYTVIVTMPERDELVWTFRTRAQ